MPTGTLLIGPLLVLSCTSSGAQATSGDSNKINPGAACLEAAGAERSPKQEAPESIGVSHVLVRHKDLDRPQEATRTRDEACLRALKAKEALESGQSWNEVTDEYSDSKGVSHGDLGVVSQDELAGSFGDAAFSLDVDELSYVVESERGFHIILRTQ